MVMCENNEKKYEKHILSAITQLRKASKICSSPEIERTIEELLFLPEFKTYLILER